MYDIHKEIKGFKTFWYMGQWSTMYKVRQGSRNMFFTYVIYGWALMQRFDASEWTNKRNPETIDGDLWRSPFFGAFKGLTDDGQQQPHHFQGIRNLSPLWNAMDWPSLLFAALHTTDRQCHRGRMTTQSGANVRCIVECSERVGRSVGQASSPIHWAIGSTSDRLTDHGLLYISEWSENQSPT